MSWDEYAALTRHLGAVRQAAANQQSAGRRQHDAARERADRLDAHLTAQRQRLIDLAARTGQSTAALSAPVAPSPPTPLPPTPPAPAPSAPPAQMPLPGAPTAALPAPTDPPALTTAPHPAPPAGLPGAMHVPAQRTGPPPVLATPTPPAPQAPGDPWTILDAAESYAHAADRAAAHTEAAAVRPALLPGATPLTRSLAAYGACAGAALIIQSGLLLVSGNAAGYTWSIGAWMCTGLPALAFFGGFALLTLWGRPAVPDGRPVDRHVRLGFAICFLALPVAVCGYLALIQLIRR